MDKQRILVVDDEEDLREILKFNLESEGYLVDTAPSAEEALKMLAEEYNLILLDVMMGGMSGFKMAEKLRKDLHNSTPDSISEATIIYPNLSRSRKFQQE